MDLNEIFNVKVKDMAFQLKQNTVVKAIGERQLTGNMLLNLAMEFVD